MDARSDFKDTLAIDKHALKAVEFGSKLLLHNLR